MIHVKRATSTVFSCGLAAVLLAACSTLTQASSQSTVTTAPPPTTGAPVTTAPATTAPVATSSTTTTSAAAAPPPACVHRALSVTEGRRSAALGTVDVPILIANTGSDPCSLSGYPTVTFAAQPGSSSPPVTHQGTAHVFKVAPAPVTLAPGGAPSAGIVIEYFEQPSNGATEYVSSGVDITFTPPGGTFEVTGSLYAYGSVAVSPIVESSQVPSGTGTGAETS